MTELNKFLITNNFSSLKNKTTEELIILLNNIYDYCNQKYGKVPGSFFTATWQPNTKIKRGAEEGLDIHHKFEYDPNNSEVCSLSDTVTAKMWFSLGYIEYQLPENLVYCNWIEHQAIHAIIDILRTRQYGKYRPGCIELRRAPVLSRYFNNPNGYINTIMLNENFTAKNYFKVALETCKDELETYQLIMDEWAEAVGVDDWLILGYTLESLENCFETYSED